jgi:sarcosine oxidase subunit beta
VLALKSLDIYAHWAERVGGDAGYRRTGFLWLDHVSRRDKLAGYVAMLRGIGSDSRLIEADELTRLQPHMTVDETIAVYEPNCGTAYGAKANDALLTGAVERGVRLLTRTPALSLIESGGRLTGIRTPKGEIHAETVVLAAGAWSAPLARSIGLELAVEARRLTIGRVLLPPGIKQPMTFLDGRYDTSFRPEDGSTAIISMRDGGYGRPIDPDSRKEDVDPSAVAGGIARLSRRIPIASRAIGLNTWTGVDGFTPDYKAIYGRHHDCANLIVIAGCSEKGLKVAPAVGMGTAELIATGHSTDLEKPEFSSARFLGRSSEVAGGQIVVDELI